MTMLADVDRCHTYSMGQPELAVTILVIAIGGPLNHIWLPAIANWNVIANTGLGRHSIA